MSVRMVIHRFARPLADGGNDTTFQCRIAGVGAPFLVQFKSMIFHLNKIMANCNAHQSNILPPKDRPPNPVRKKSFY